MAIAADNFFNYVDDFFKYRREIYEVSTQTLKSNRVDLTLFENFIKSQDEKIINGPAMIDFQYYLKNRRENCGSSINRKIFTLRSYGNFLKLYDAPFGNALPFYDILKIRQGYRRTAECFNSSQQIKLFFKTIDAGTILGVQGLRRLCADVSAWFTCRRSSFP